MNSDEVLVSSPEWIASDKSELTVDTRIGVGIPMVVLVVLYLLIILKIGPRFMESRAAFKLKGFIILYNICQIFGCSYAIIKIYFIDLPTLTYGACVDVVPGALLEKEFNQISSFLFWLKAAEMIETVVFVLRKKQNQVTFLHVFHHCAVLFLTFNLHTTYRNSAALFPFLLNSCVHIIMYTYYLMAAVLPSKVVAVFTPLKKAITTIQMIQFTIILLQIIVVKSRGCQIPEIMLAIYIAIIVVIFYGFYDFYKKSYTVDEKTKLTAKEKH